MSAVSRLARTEEYVIVEKSVKAGQRVDASWAV